MKNVFLTLFIIFSIIHLWASFKDHREYRSFSKPFLLLFLLLYYLSHGNINVNLSLALFFSWLGDILLIPKGHHWFVFGGVSFMLSHIFFILVYIINIVTIDIPIIIIIVISLLYFGISLIIINSVSDNTPRKMLFPMYFYLVCNSVMNIFALIRLFSLRNQAAFISYIGALLFFISDCLLFLVRYHKNENIIFKKHFFVMLAYLLGEFLIVLGVILLK